MSLLLDQPESISLLGQLHRNLASIRIRINPLLRQRFQLIGQRFLFDLQLRQRFVCRFNVLNRRLSRVLIGVNLLLDLFQLLPLVFGLR